MGDLTVIILAILIIFLCWVIVKVNEKLDKYIKRFKRLEKALMKNATGKIQVQENPSNQSDELPNMDVPMASTHKDLNCQRQTEISSIAAARITD